VPRASLKQWKGVLYALINRKPLFVAFLAAMLLLCAGCNDGRAAPTPASGKAAEGHDTAIPSEITEDVETPAVTIGDIAEDITWQQVMVAAFSASANKKLSCSFPIHNRE
jgi:hypothetical protein